MSQINIKKTNSDSFTQPGADRRGVGFDELGNFGYIDENGNFVIIGGGVVLGVADIEAYNPANTYAAGKFVSYSSGSPGFTEPGIYMTIGFADLAESPEANPELWEYQGTAIDSGTVESGGAGIVYTTGYQEITGKKWIKNRLLLKQHTDDIPTAEALTLFDANYYRFSDIANEVKTINRVGWTGGTPVWLELKTGGRVAHLAAAGGNNRAIRLSAGVGLQAPEPTMLMLLYDEVALLWKEVGRTALLDGKTRIPFTVNVTAADVSGGTLMLTPSVDFGSGTVKLYDGKGNEFVLTNGVAASVQYESADLDGETEKDFTWILETDAPMSVSEIDFDQCNIVDFFNLTSLTSLNNFFVGSSKLVEVDFTGKLPESLSYLDIKGCDKMESFTLQNHENVANLFIGDGTNDCAATLRYWDTSGCTSLLRILDVLEGVRFDITPSMPLETFDISYNAFTRVETDGVTCQIIGLSTLPSIRYLDIAYCLNTSFDELKPLSTLVELYINNTLIQCDDISYFPILTRLDISYTNIKKYPDALFDLTTLIELRIDNNPFAYVDFDFTAINPNIVTISITGIDYIETINISGLSKLVNFYLSKTANGLDCSANLQSFNANGCLKLYRTTYFGNDIRINYCPGLSFIDITNCGINGSQKYYNIDNNSILTSVVGLSTLTNLISLYIENNSFSTLDLAGLSSIVKLSAEGNNLVNISNLATSANMTILWLDNNSASSTTVDTWINDLWAAAQINPELSGTAEISGSNGVRTIASDTAVSGLTTGPYSWSLTLN